MTTPNALTPHGPGFRFVDTFALGDKQGHGVSSLQLHPEAWYFQDHFPNAPIMPAAFLLEHAAQTAGILWMSLTTSEASADPTPLFVASVDAFRIQGAALPGNLLNTRAELLKEFGTLAQFQFETWVSEKLIARGRITLSNQVAANA